MLLPTHSRAFLSLVSAQAPVFRSIRSHRLYTNVAASAQRSASASTRRRNVAITSLILSAGGITALLLQAYNSPELHADAIPTRKTLADTIDKSRKTRHILHGIKRDTYPDVDIEAILKRCEETTQTGTGVWYQLNQIGSNYPIEDDHAEARVTAPSGSSNWHFWAVIDGHVSWETSAALAERLIPSVNGALQGLYSRQGSPSSDSIDSAIKGAFVSLDNDFVYGSLERALESDSRRQAAQLLSQAWAGAVAMLAFYDQALGTVKVALTGDLRAVRGRRTADGKWESAVLTVEQDGENEDEARRIRQEHPDEPDVIKGGRVLGFQPTRMFGDASLKWSPEVQRMLHSKFMGLRLRDVVKTPPYVKAEPVITTTDIKEGDFLILGCDGLWESLNSQEAVNLVGEWISTYAPKHIRPASNSSDKKKKVDGVSSSESPSNKEKTIRYEQWRIPKKFVTKDDNAATHLIRNALGGADEETMAALLTRTGTLSRRLRDDITVTVVFFGEPPAQ